VSYPEYLGEPAKLPGRGEPARPAFIRDWPHAEWLAVAAVCFGAVTSSLDNGVITVAYPRLESQLHRPASQVAWIVLISLLTVVSTLVLFGQRGDYVGRKRVYLDGFVVFIGGAIACAASVGYLMLLAARVVEALGVAMIQANSVALVTSSVRREHRTTALGIQASAQATGLAAGPFVGALIAPHVGWRALFLVSTPFAATALVASMLFIPRSRTTRHAPRLNIAGALVLALAAGGVIGGLTIAAKSGWHAASLSFLAVGVAASAALVPVERRSPSPLFEPRIVSRRPVQRSLPAIAVSWVVFFGLLTAVPWFVERDLHDSLIAGGAAVIAMPVGLVVMAPLIGTLRRRVSTRAIAIGATTAVLAAIVATRLDHTLLGAVVALVVVGAGVGATNTLNSAVVMNESSEEDRGVASSLVNLSRASGSAVGVAVASTFFVLAGERSAASAMVALAVAAGISWVAAVWPQPD
jgi:MFS family permease